MAFLLLLLSLMGTTSRVFADDYVYKFMCDGDEKYQSEDRRAYCDIPGIALDEWSYYDVDMIKDYSTANYRCEKGTGYAFATHNGKLQLSLGWMCHGYFGIRPKERGFPYKGGCGQDNFGGFKIINGYKAHPCEFPWMAAVRLHWTSNSHYMNCGGSIIDKSWILTAAHCIIKEHGDGRIPPTDSITIYTGSLRRPQGALPRSVEEIVAHPEYDHKNLKYDIILLKLDKPIKWDGCHSPVCLNDKKTVEDSDSLSCRVSGWGKHQLQGSPWPPGLLWAYDSILSRQECDSIYKRYSNDYTLCGRATANSRRGFCGGDSGGPLVCKKDGDDRFYQHGIVSAYFLASACRMEGLYTSVGALHDWITSHI